MRLTYKVITSVCRELPRPRKAIDRFPQQKMDQPSGLIRRLAADIRPAGALNGQQFRWAAKSGRLAVKTSLTKSPTLID